MNNKPDPSETLVMPAPLRGWERFWFAPADPTLLGLIRICCGLITLYTALVYSFELQTFKFLRTTNPRPSVCSNVKPIGRCRLRFSLIRALRKKEC